MLAEMIFKFMELLIFYFLCLKIDEKCLAE